MTKVTNPALIPPDAPKNEWGVPACPECGRFDFKARTALGLHRSQQHGIPGQSKSAKDARRVKSTVKSGPVEHNTEHLKVKPIPPDTKKNSFGVPICPECGKDDFPMLNALGNHRRKIHGIVGSTNPIAVTKDYKMRCPVPGCGLPVKDKIGLGTHMKAAHGISGASKPSALAPAALVHRGRPKGVHTPHKAAAICQHCDPPKQFKNHLGLTIHQANIHGIKGTTHMSAAERRETLQNAMTISTPLPTTRKVKANGSIISNGHSPEISRSSEPPLTAEDLLIFQTIGELKGHCRFVAESAGFPTAQFTARVILALHSQTRR